MIDRGLLLVYGETGPNVTEAEFNDWYDNEHAPARLTVPGISTAARYKAADGTSPSWIAIYDARDIAVLSSEAYKNLMAEASDREKALIPRLQLLQRGIYELSDVFEKNGATEDVQGWRGSHLFIVESRYPMDGEEIDQWYLEEHIPQVRNATGFLRARRYSLSSYVKLAGEGDDQTPASTLEVYEWDDDENLSSAKVIKGTGITGWVLSRKLRSFKVHRKFFQN